MAQEQVVDKRFEKRAFPGYGVVFPDGRTPLKVKHTYTEGPTKIHNMDGTTEFTVSPPTIHELVEGGFSYADGSPVTLREHLEKLPRPMRDRALQWFDNKDNPASDGSLGVVEEKTPMKDFYDSHPDIILSTEIEPQGSPVKAEIVVVQDEMKRSIKAIEDAVLSLSEMMKSQRQEIETLKATPRPAPIPRKRSRGDKRARHGMTANQALKKIGIAVVETPETGEPV